MLLWMFSRVSAWNSSLVELGKRFSCPVVFGSHCAGVHAVIPWLKSLADNSTRILFWSTILAPTHGTHLCNVTEMVVEPGSTRPTADEAKMLARQITENKDAVEDYKHQPSNTDARIEGVERSISELEVESMKGDHAGTKRSLTANETLAAKLAESWDNQSSEWEERRKSRAMEILAIHETIKLLNCDDALELVKATLTSPSLVQVLQSTVAVARRAMDELRRSSRMLSNSASNLNLIFVALNGKSVDLSKVISVIDETVTLLKAEQGDDDGKKAYCTESLGQTEDEGKVLAHQVSGHRDAIAVKDQLSNTDARIERIVEETTEVPIPQEPMGAFEAGKLIPHDKVQKWHSRTNRCRTNSTDSERNWRGDPASSATAKYHCGEKIAKLKLIYFELIFAN